MGHGMVTDNMQQELSQINKHFAIISNHNTPRTVNVLQINITQSKFPYYEVFPRITHNTGNIFLISEQN